MNLIVNAAQAIGPERGTITLRNGVGDETVWIEVADNGSGIPRYPAENLRPVLHHQTHRPGHRAWAVVVLRHREKHNGEITVSSEVGVGTTFRVELPVRQMKQAS
ncbi:ATP-binding protein [Pseudomonas sp. NA13]